MWTTDFNLQKARHFENDKVENENRVEMCERFFNLEKSRKLKVRIQKIVRKRRAGKFVRPISICEKVQHSKMTLKSRNKFQFEFVEVKAN